MQYLCGGVLKGYPITQNDQISRIHGHLDFNSNCGLCAYFLIVVDQTTTCPTALMALMVPSRGLQVVIRSDDAGGHGKCDPSIQTLLIKWQQTKPSKQPTDDDDDVGVV